jgi:Rubredoxin-like zinc ribbon domain (DUF35_N)
MSDWSRVTRPIPVPNEWTKPFWDAAKRGELSLQRCQACKHFQHPPYATCVRCMAIDLAFEPVSRVNRRALSRGRGGRSSASHQRSPLDWAPSRAVLTESTASSKWPEAAGASARRPRK